MEKYMKISEFAKYAGISRKTLIFYDQSGLLSPESVGENQYRLYSYRQLDAVSVIWALRQTGMSLKEIKKYMDNKSPAALMEILSTLQQNLDKKIQELQQIQRMIEIRLETTTRGLTVNPKELLVQQCPEEILFIGPYISWTQDTTFDNAIYEFYNACDREKVINGYSLGAIFPLEELLSPQEVPHPTRFYYHYADAPSAQSRTIKPAGLYVIGFGRDLYGQHQDLFQRLLPFLKENHLEPIGDVYGEFLLDEVSTIKEEERLIQFSIPVKKNFRCQSAIKAEPYDPLPL